MGNLQLRPVNSDSRNPVRAAINNSSNAPILALALGLHEGHDGPAPSTRSANQDMELVVHTSHSTETIFQGTNPEAIRNALTTLGLNVSGYTGSLRDLRTYFLSNTDSVTRTHHFQDAALDTQIQGAGHTLLYRRLNSFMQTWNAIDTVNVGDLNVLDANEISRLNQNAGANDAHIDVYSFLLYIRWSNKDTQVEDRFEQVQRLASQRSRYALYGALATTGLVGAISVIRLAIKHMQAAPLTAITADTAEARAVHSAVQASTAALARSTFFRAPAFRLGVGLAAIVGFTAVYGYQHGWFNEWLRGRRAAAAPNQAAL